MAQRYITAMDFADMRARKILRKQAKVSIKNPLMAIDT